ncbi:hypothetical protein FJU08_01325 [Martelella alba]|uniref:TerL n=1 Tax=Martelella alba TaxID=2590451 RepID=A0A506UIR8_9HYPH|nr:hypothetical protein [Martelella alba]TPW33234.1 hypothetical protein FJU08_01325 [Martelella alba]
MSDRNAVITRDDLRALSAAEERALVARYEIDEKFNPFSYTPPGPVAQAFILSNLPTAVIMGPLGGGKTTACTFKRIYEATQAPIAWHPADGKPTRMCRWIVLRDTFRSAEKTVLESWKQWFPKGYPGSSWAGGNDRPVTHTLRFMGSDGIRIEAITEFAGLGENSIETMMKGREYSGGWLNETDTHADGSIDDMEQRVGRYPSAAILLSVDELEDLGRKLGHRLVSGQRKSVVIGDMNAPTIDNWTYRVLVKLKTPDRHLFEQPSGRADDAENRYNLEPDYYDRIVRNQEDWFIRRMVDNKFGYSRAGKPVYDGFDRPRHVARSRIIVDPRLALGIGVDISMNTLNPAAVFGQVHAPGRIMAVRELYLGHGVGAARFGEAMLQCLSEHFSNASKVRLWVDPAAEYGADREGGQLTAMETLSVILGIPVLIPAGGSNELGMRLDAVKTELRGYIEPNTHLQIDPEGCPLLLEGFEGKYRYKRKPEKASTDYEEQPEKTHPWSDLQDGLQYLILGFRGRAGIIRGAADKDREPKNSGAWSSQKRSSSTPWGQQGFDPHAVGLKR